MNNLTQLFCDVDDFCKDFIPTWEKTLLENGKKRRPKNRSMSDSEIITITIYYQLIGFRTFKWFYTNYLRKHLRSEFPNILSYNRFIELQSEILYPLTCFMQTRCGQSKGIAFIDATPLRVCQNIRIPRHQTFEGVAQRGKCSTGWFYGFKLHLIVNDQGEILAFSITPGNVDDRKPVPKMAQDLMGKLYGDRGYISQKLFNQLYKEGLQLITGIKKNMKNKLLPLFDKVILRKRSIIETINDQLKNILQIEHSRHRSLTNYMVDVVSALVAYTYGDKLPSLNIENLNLLPLIDA